MLQSLCKVR